ncbi:MAG: urea carboxylase [Herbaspirillum sp.]|jgi:urea carboxylase-associated protein 1|nr:urea carboxylase [Herbaspirillum sp.]
MSTLSQQTPPSSPTAEPFGNVLFHEVIAAGGRWSRRMEPGERLRIIDLEGQQAVDFLCYSPELPMDRLNIPNTVKLNKSLYITEGCKIYSDHAKVMFSVVSDSCGFHDTLAGCCSNEIDLVRYGVVKTKSCRANFIAELADWSMAPSEIVSNINFFMRVAFSEDGSVAIAPGVSKPGDHVELQAEMPVIAMLSNCPQEHNPASGFKPTPIEVIVYRP